MVLFCSGAECLRQLISEGIKCSYVLISAVSYIMKEVGERVRERERGNGGNGREGWERGNGNRREGWERGIGKRKGKSELTLLSTILSIPGLQGDIRCTWSASKWLCYVSNWHLPHRTSG